MLNNPPKLGRSAVLHRLLVDYNVAVVIGTATIGGASANTQWQRSGACSFTHTTSGEQRQLLQGKS